MIETFFAAIIMAVASSNEPSTNIIIQPAPMFVPHITEGEKMWEIPSAFDNRLIKFQPNYFQICACKFLKDLITNKITPLCICDDMVNDCEIEN